MTRTRNRRLRWTLTVPLLALVMSVGALGSAAPQASAVDGDYVTFVDLVGGVRLLSSGAPDGTSKAALTPAGYRAYALAVAADGQAYVVGLGQPDVAKSNWDRSYGLVYVRRSGDVTTTRILTNYWEDAAISADGSTVWWLRDGVLWQHSAGVSTPVDAETYLPPAGWEVLDLAVSPDGLRAAVTYYQASGTDGRVVAAVMSEGYTGPYVEQTMTRQPTFGQIFWEDEDTVSVAFGTYGSVVVEQASLVDVGPNPLHASPWSPGLDDVYDVSRVGSVWWGWRDVGDVTEYATVTDLAGFATATWGQRIDGPTSGYYRPSSAAPPAMTTPVNRPSTHPYLYLSASSTTYGKKLVYSSWAEYLVPLLGQTLANDAAEVDRGMLQKSTNGGSTWTDVGWTSWSNPVPWPPDTRYYGNGYTPTLTRNTWFRWKYPGDLLTLSSTSTVRKVVVSPTITVSKIRSSSGTTKVYGKVTRVGGTIQLWRWTGSSWVKVATVSISSTGSYSFGYRSLRRGTYKVVVPATTYWGAASKKLTI